MNKLLELKKKFETEKNKEYEIKIIINNMIYGKKVNNQISGFY